jgi:hypothetical protein
MMFFTLNNDLLLETFFKENGIPYVDGFSSPSGKNDLRFWEWDGFDGASQPIILAKLHGSINWFSSGTKIVSTPIHDPSQGDTLKGPLILIGRDNKLQDYPKPMFQELHSQFYCRLKELNRLIVCGYGLVLPQLFGSSRSSWGSPPQLTCQHRRESLCLQASA